MRHLPRAAAPTPTHGPDRQLARWVGHVTLAGMAMVLVWPAARGYSDWLGWLPLWLVAMPASAWWALYRFPLPPFARLRRAPALRRRRGPQARRLPRGHRRSVSRAA